MPYAAASAAAYAKVTALFAPAGCEVICTVVNLPLNGVPFPTATLLMLPVVFGLIVTVPLLVGLKLTTASFPLKATFPVAVNVVNVAGAGVVAPIATLLIFPVTVGLTINVPVPVGLIVTLALAGLKLTVDSAVKPLNVPACGVVAPITTLLIAPIVEGLTVTELVTVKSAIDPLVLNVIELVVALVVMEIPPSGTSVRVLLVELRLIVFCPDTAR